MSHDPNDPPFDANDPLGRAARAVWPFLGRVARDAAHAVRTTLERELEPLQRARRSFEIAVEAAAIRFAAERARTPSDARRVLILGRAGTGNDAADRGAEALVTRLRAALAPRSLVATVLVEEAHHEATAFSGARFAAIAGAGVGTLWSEIETHDAVIACDLGGAPDIIGVRTIGALGLASAAGRPAFALALAAPAERRDWLARMMAKARVFGADPTATAAWSELGLATEDGRDAAFVATRIAEALA